MTYLLLAALIFWLYALTRSHLRLMGEVGELLELIELRIDLDDLRAKGELLQ